MENGNWEDSVEGVMPGLHFYTSLQRLSGLEDFPCQVCLILELPVATIERAHRGGIPSTPA